MDQRGTTPPMPTLMRADVEAAVRLLGGCQYRKRRAGFEIVHAADRIAHDRHIGPDDDVLLSVLVFDGDDRTVHAGHRRANRTVCHRTVRRAVPRPEAFTGAAHRFGEDVNLDGLLRAIGLRHCPAADEFAVLDVSQRCLVDIDDRRLVGEIDFQFVALVGLRHHGVAVDFLDGSAQPHRLRRLRMGRSPQATRRG